jgi:hypothetical protein
MELRPQDVVVVLKLLASGFNPWSYARLGEELLMSPSHVHASVARAETAHLLAAFNISSSARRRGRGVLPEPNRNNLKEFLIHGVKYAFPVQRGGLTRGVPTAEGASPLKEHFPGNLPLPPVWPYAKGTVRGVAFEPLYNNVPEASLRDSALYRLLVLVDAIREGRTREREIAIRELTTGIDAAASQVQTNSL